MTGLRAIMVAVDYTDLLRVTLPYNRHHFDEVWIITDRNSYRGVRDVADRVPPVHVLDATDAFYSGGAKFNKWAALEYGFSQMGRHGWICNMDADVLWPRKVEVVPESDGLRFWHGGNSLRVDRGQLMSPLRRMAPWPCPKFRGATPQVSPYPQMEIVGDTILPGELLWDRFPIHRNVGEWAGYTQVFHATDPHLGPAPWHQVDWTHAGGADTFFQRKWPNECKRRPAWQVLHLGEAGKNWFGRATADDQGEVPADAAEKLRMVGEVWTGRAERRRQGMTEAETFRPEKLG